LLPEVVIATAEAILVFSLTELIVVVKAGTSGVPGYQ
jgi:hypothetical protein